MDERPPRLSKVEHALRREQWAAQGRFDAFSFAADCNGDIPKLKAEIEEKEELIARMLAAHPKGPMAPGASPRIYRDAYLAALREAIEIVVKLSEQDSEHSTRV